MTLFTLVLNFCIACASGSADHSLNKVASHDQSHTIAQASAKNGKELASSGSPFNGWTAEMFTASQDHQAHLRATYTSRMLNKHHVGRGLKRKDDPVESPVEGIALPKESASPAPLVPGAVSFVDAAREARKRYAHRRTSLRPGAGGAADVVEFGIYAKNFYGVDLKDNTFRIDIVTTLKWTDPRAAELVPHGNKRVAFSTEEAESTLWQPDIIITNHEILMYEVISSSVEVFSDGAVEKVERAQVQVNNMFELSNYPFDVQELRVKIASTKYMLNDVMLVPLLDKSSSGASDFLFKTMGLYTLKSWSTSVYEEADGNLIKSRGLLEIVVNRKLDKYIQDHLVPLFIILAVSWGVFYFPFAKPFATPRLVLSIMALLTFTHITIKSAAMLPGSAPFNWNDLLNQMVQLCILFTVLINIVSETCEHHFELAELAQHVNHEAKMLQPGISIFLIAMTLTLGTYHVVGLWTASCLTQAFFLAAYASYGYWTWKRFHEHHERVKQKSYF